MALNETANFPKADRATGTDTALAADGLLPAPPMGSRAEHDGNLLSGRCSQAFIESPEASNSSS